MGLWENFRNAWDALWGGGNGGGGGNSNPGGGGAPGIPNPVDEAQKIRALLETALPTIAENLAKLVVAAEQLKESIANKTPDLSPSDPVAVLRHIADAITGAEGVLNKSSLVIANSTVEAEVYLEIAPGVAGARAKFTLNVTPKPIT